MKTRIIIPIVAVVVGAGLLSSFAYFNSVSIVEIDCALPYVLIDGQCKLHPCFNKEANHLAPCFPDNSIQFYEYKGEEWMEAKKQELFATIRNNTFHEWVDLTKEDHSHFNVYMYYSATGELEELTKELETEPDIWDYENDEWSEKEEQLTMIEIFFGDILDDGLVPVTFTEITTNTINLDEILVWNFELIGHSGDDRRIAWDKLPQDKRIWYEITDNDGLDIRIPENIVVPSDLHNYQMDCGLFHTVEGESAHPTLIPIKNNVDTIFAKNAQKGIYPNSNGEYSFEFASIFYHYVTFPEDSAEIIYQESKNCKLTQNIEEDPEGKYTDGYYTKMVFRLESELSFIDVFEVAKDDVAFDVRYNVTGGTVEDMTYSADINLLLVTIDSTDEGSLTLSIPRALHDAKFDYCPPVKPNPPDDAFFVLLDGEEILYEEILTTTTKRTLQIPFPENTMKIEIVSSCLI